MYIYIADEYRAASLQPPKTASGERKDGYEKVDHTEEAYFLKDDEEEEGQNENQSMKKSQENLEFISGGVLHLDSLQSINTSSQIKLVPYELNDSESSESEDELTVGVRKRSLKSAGMKTKIAINLRNANSTSKLLVENEIDANLLGSSSKRRKLI